MKVSVKFPLRFKILIAQLLVVTVVISLITFTMARLFHQDKTAYIHDLTSTMALHTAEEANTLLLGYRQRATLFARVLLEGGIAGREEVLRGLFEEFGDFVMVSCSSSGAEETVYDDTVLASSAVSREALARFHARRPLPVPLREGELYLEPATVSATLPAFALTVVQPREGGGTVTACAVIRLEKLQRLARRSRIFETFLMDGSGFFLAQSDPKRGGQQAPALWRRLASLPTPGMTTEYTDRQRGMVGGFAPVRCGGLTAVVQIPKSAAYVSSHQLLENLMGLSLVLLGAAALLSLFWSHRLTRPIEKLSEATRMVGQGEFQIEVPADSRDEIGALAGSFNTMAVELHNRETALKELYGKLIQSEKMAAFGALGAGIAHEVKNPLAGILGMAQLSLRAVEAGTPVEKNLRIIEKETKRCKSIIENLMRFARQEQVEFSEVAVSQVVTDALAIVDHQMGINNIRVEQELEEELPPCRGNANQLQQVLMNLMINAQQAMDGAAGTVKLSAKKGEDGGVELRVSDTGPGIPQELQAKIFEPFFTTKPAGKGTGLGLSVTYGIIKDHGGEIKVESGTDIGTTFVISLPAFEAAGASR